MSALAHHVTTVDAHSGHRSADVEFSFFVKALFRFSFLCDLIIYSFVFLMQYNRFQTRIVRTLKHCHFCTLFLTSRMCFIGISTNSKYHIFRILLDVLMPVVVGYFLVDQITVSP